MRRNTWIFIFLATGVLGASCKKTITPQAFIEAAKSGDLASVRDALESKIDVNTVDGRGYTALYWAARSGHDEIVNLLISSKADINMKYFKDRAMTALILAAEAGHGKVVSALIKAGADLEQRDSSGASALHWAVKNAHADWAPKEGRIEIVKALVDAKANLYATDYRGGTPLMVASYYKFQDVAKLLREAGAK